MTNLQIISAFGELENFKKAFVKELAFSKDGRVSMRYVFTVKGVTLDKEQIKILNEIGCDNQIELFVDFDICDILDK